MAEQRGNATLPQAVALAVEAGLMEARTATPAMVESYAGGRAVVVPLLKRKTAAGVVIDPKPIGNVPVAQRRGGGFASTMPVDPGDIGFLICSDRSLDAWLESGGKVDPKSGRHHQLTDGVFFPFYVGPWNDPIPTYDDSDLVIAKEDASIQLRITADGKMIFRGASGTTSAILIDGAGASFHTSLAASLTELAGLLAGLGLVAATTTGTMVPALSTGTWRATKGEGI